MTTTIHHPDQITIQTRSPSRPDHHPDDTSPKTCIFAFNRTSSDHREQYPEAVDSVQQNFDVEN
ncbi:Uncharacterized protein APZ42_030031 [Daphnia magna]|nr:Uncharacterized protein APZ42_030031 [Daphnia magna]